MRNLIVALIIIALVVGGYRFISSQRKKGETQTVETIEAETTIVPTIKSEQEIISSEKTDTDNDLPSSGVSTEDKEAEIPSQEEIEKIIQEFRQ
ncbi:hypothetical protein ISS85_03740 [Candidatus Microgenomates bacterium]|nr:hypothetical protein [Candidatus Microgenomates bacterium]